MGYPRNRAITACYWSVRVVSAIAMCFAADAAPRLTELADIRIGNPTFFNRQEGWAVSGPSLLRTVDGGSTWKQVKIFVAGKQTNGEIRGTYFVSAKSAWLTLAQGDGLRQRVGLSPEFVSTHDGGSTWRAETLPGADWFFDSLSATDDPRGPVWLGGQTSHESVAPVENMECPQRVKGFIWSPTIYFRSAPGSDWEEQQLPVQNGCPVSMVRFTDKTHGVAVIGSEIVFSEDGGKHWSRSVIHTTRKILPAVSLQFRGSEGWIGSHGEVLYTADAGQHWQEIVAARTLWSKELGFGPWGAVYFTSATTGFILGGGGEVFETSDRGKTWSKVALPDRIVNFSCADNVCWLASEQRLYRLEGE